MSMPIQRQSESFGYFDDGPRYARDRNSADLPRGLAGLINTSGPRIQAGLLNTRTASCDYCGEPGHDWEIHPEARADVAEWDRERHRQEFPFGDYQGDYHHEARLAINFGPGPRDHGGAGPDGGPSVPDWFYDEDGEDEDPELDGLQDPDRYLPETSVDPGDSDPGLMPYGPGGEWIGDEDGRPAPRRHWNPNSGYEPTDEDERYSEREARRGSGRHPFDRAAARRLAKDGGCTCWEGYERVPGTKPCASGSCRKKAGRRVALAPADPAAVAPQMPAGGGYQPAHRVGLPWRDSVIPGTVIGLDGSQVAIRWDDGQYSSEEPRNIRLL